MATADLLDLVVQTAYTGQAWAELQRRLVKRAFPDLERAVRSGAIYRRVRAGRLQDPAAQGVAGPPVPRLSLVGGPGIDLHSPLSVALAPASDRVEVVRMIDAAKRAGGTVPGPARANYSASSGRHDRRTEHRHHRLAGTVRAQLARATNCRRPNRFPCRNARTRPAHRCQSEGAPWPPVQVVGLGHRRSSSCPAMLAAPGTPSAFLKPAFRRSWPVGVEPVQHGA